MNCLAHALLAGDGPGLAVAGVGGDWIKGRRPAAARLPLRLMAVVCVKLCKYVDQVIG